MTYSRLLALLFVLLTQTTFGRQSNIDKYLLQADSAISIASYEAAEEFLLAALSYDNITTEQRLSILLQLADLKYQVGDFGSAYEQYTEVLQLARANNLSNKSAQALTGLAHILWRTGDNIKSITSIIESIEIYKVLNDTTGYIEASDILAGIYMSIGKLDEAEHIYDEMLQTAIHSEDSTYIARNYGYKGVLAFFRDDFKLAIAYYNKALKINLQINDRLEVAIVYGNMGESYGRLGEFDKAIEYFNKALTIQQRLNFLSGQIFIYYSLGEIYMQKGDHIKAQELFNESLDLMNISGESREKHYVYNLIAKNYAQQGNFEKAYQFHQLFTNSKDSIFNTDKNQKLEEIRAKYDFEQQERENYFLAQQNDSKARELQQKQEVITRQYILGGLILVLLLISIYLSVKLFRNKKLLTKANTSKDKLFGFIAHDLKAPIGNIKSLTDILSPHSESLVDGVEKQKMWLHLHNASNTVLALLNDMLSWSLTQQQGFNFKPTHVNLRDVVHYNLELFNYQLSIKNILLNNTVPGDLAVFVDADALSTIVRNLLSNAVKFTPQNGTIAIDACRDGRQVRLMVKDNGIGMKAEQIESLLANDKYESTSGTDNEKGTGLGFNLIKDFVDQSGGRVEVQSQPKRGTSFYVFLPAID